MERHEAKVDYLLHQPIGDGEAGHRSFDPGLAVIWSQAKNYDRHWQ